MAKIIFKPVGSGQVGHGAFTAYVENTNLVSGGIYDAKGNLVDRFNKFQGTPEGGAPPAIKFYTNKPGSAYGEGFYAQFTDREGKVYKFKVPSGSERFVGDFSNPDSLKADPSGDGGSKDAGGGGGFPGGFAPGQTGYGSFPAFLGGEFPNPFLINYKNIQTAPYKFTDPFQFAQKYGDFSRGELRKNFDLSKDLALSELDTELKGMQNFVPAAAALKRQEVSLDNQFNQAERLKQVNSALPNAQGDLADQATRARTLASGRLPSSIEDRALEVGVRSEAADLASGGGFGVSSSAARKTSDLLSANQRLDLSKYGDQLLSQNINQSASLFLAPTEYSNAGQQINVNPSVSASQLTANNLGQVNAATLVSPGQALSTEVQQNQFTTGLEQQTRQFNAGNQLNVDQFNANAKNTFALDKFGYLVSYANSLAGASQVNTNTNVALQQQALAQQIAQEIQSQAQHNQTIGSIFQGISSIFGGNGGIGNTISSIAGLFGLNAALGGSSGAVTSLSPEIASSLGIGVATDAATGGTILAGGTGISALASNPATLPIAVALLASTPQGQKLIKNILGGAGDLISSAVGGAGDLIKGIGHAVSSLF